MARVTGQTQQHLSAQIRRQISAELTSRYLRALPGFKVEPELPAALREKLEEIERRERRRRES